MKTHIVSVAAASALFLFNGCQVPVTPPVAKRETTATKVAPKPASTATTPATPAAPDTRAAEIARILDLKARGVITEGQAQQIINEMMNESSTARATPASSATTAPATVTSTRPVVAATPAPSSATAPAAQPPAVVAAEPALDPRYKPKILVHGRLRSIGSDTMDLVVASWEEIFSKYHPNLRILHEGRGTSTATPALMENQSDIGPMSRPMLEAEAAKFRERFGYDATQIRTAIDALGIYVHPDNPLAKTGLTMAQVDAIFSASRKRGEKEQLAAWGQLGLTAEWANAPIRVYGRNRASGTYGFFRDTALSKGEFGAWVAEQPSSAMVVEKVEGDKFGIGFSGVGYKTPGVAMVPLAKETGARYVAPAEETALDGTYPLARPLLLALNRNPAAPMSDLQREFMTFVLSPLGQEVVKKEGYYPLPAKILAEETAKLR